MLEQCFGWDNPVEIAIGFDTWVQVPFVNKGRPYDFATGDAQRTDFRIDFRDDFAPDFPLPLDFNDADGSVRL